MSPHGSLDFSPPIAALMAVGFVIICLGIGGFLWTRRRRRLDEQTRRADLLSAALRAAAELRLAGENQRRAHERKFNRQQTVAGSAEEVE
jgi:hypothetical protein